MGALLASQVADRLIDFSNPRRRIEKKRPVRLYAIAGSAAAVLALAGIAWYWMSHSALDSEIAALNEVIKKNEDSIKAASKKVTDWSKVERFLKGDHPWLDELEYLSARAGNSEKAMFNVTTFTTEPSGTSTIATQFVARERDDIPEIVASFSDTLHTVKNSRVNPSKEKSSQQFPWVADLVIKIPPVSVSDPRLDTDKPVGAASKATAQAKPNTASQPIAKTPEATPEATPVNGETAETTKPKEAPTQPPPVDLPKSEPTNDVKSDTTEPVAGTSGAGA